MSKPEINNTSITQYAFRGLKFGAGIVTGLAAVYFVQGVSMECDARGFTAKRCVEVIGESVSAEFHRRVSPPAGEYLIRNMEMRQAHPMRNRGLPVTNTTLDMG